MPKDAELTIADAIRYIELKKRFAIRDYIHSPEKKAMSIKHDLHMTGDTVKVSQLTHFWQSIRHLSSHVSKHIPGEVTRKEKKELEELLDKYLAIAQGRDHIAKSQKDVRHEIKQKILHAKGL